MCKSSLLYAKVFLLFVMIGAIHVNTMSSVKDPSTAWSACGPNSSVASRKKQFQSKSGKKTNPPKHSRNKFIVRMRHSSKDSPEAMRAVYEKTCHYSIICFLTETDYTYLVPIYFHDASPQCELPKKILFHIHIYIYMFFYCLYIPSIIPACCSSFQKKMHTRCRSPGCKVTPRYMEHPPKATAAVPLRTCL